MDELSPSSAKQISPEQKIKIAAAEKKVGKEEVYGLLEMYYDISTLLTLGPSLTDVLEEMFEKTKKKIKVSGVLIWLLDKKKRAFELGASYGLPKTMVDIFAAQKLKYNQGTPGVVLKTKKFYLMKDIFNDPLAVPKYVETAAKSGAPIRSIVSFPLTIGGEIIGTFGFFFSEPKQSMSRVEFITFSTIANQIASFIQNSKILQELHEKMKELGDSKSALMNMLEDVEDSRKEAEEEKDKTLVIINNFTDGLLIFDKEGRLSLVNLQAEKFFDLKSRDIVGRRIPDLMTFPTLKPVFSAVDADWKGVWRQEVQIKEGLTLELSAVQVGREKETLGTLMVLHDITRDKMIERMKTEFVSLAAHQLRTPLSAIKWTLRMLLDGDAGSLEKEQQDLLEKSYGSNERMINLINDLLDVTRIEEGRYLYKPVLTGIEDVVSFVVNSYKEEFTKRQLKFRLFKSEKRLPRVFVDVEKIRVAVQNLLDNAIRYTKAGGEVTISLKGDKKEVEVQVKDTGAGIPQNQQDRVFTKFFRAANVMKLDTEGSGLGLFIAKNIIDAHQGKIWFVSEDGKGTTFYFTLPVKEEFGEFLKKF